MLQHYLNEKPTSVEAMTMGREPIAEKDWVASAGVTLKGFEERWEGAQKKTV